MKDRICSSCHKEIFQIPGSADHGGYCQCPSVSVHRISSGESVDLDADSFPVERYKALQRLGQGASGEVYLALDLTLGKRVAVKILHSLSRDKLIQFQDEARATSKLSHPDIIDILDFGATDSGTLYMVLEYFAGITLESYLKEYGPMPWDRLREIMIVVASALAYAHKQKIFHRDLTPSNILISTDSEVDSNVSVRLIDFGVAKVSELTGRVTEYQGRTIAGTPGYMSPDVVRGLAYGTSSEVYSLGCIIYEALCGVKPFIADTALETMALHATMTPPLLSEMTEDYIPEPFEHIVYKCLSKEPANRYGDMLELKEALQETLMESALSADEGSSYLASRPSRFVRYSSSRFVLLLFSASMVFLGFLALYFVNEEAKISNQIKDANKVFLKSSKKLSSNSNLWNPNSESSFLTIGRDLRIRQLSELSGQDLKEHALYRYKSLSFREVDQFNDSAIKQIASTDQISQLDFSLCDGFTDSVMMALVSGLNSNIRHGENLESFSIYACTNITDHCAVELAKLKGLKRLSLKTMLVGNKTARSVSKLDLIELTLMSTQIDDLGLKELSKIKTLKRLVLRDLNRFTMGGVKAFRKAQPNCLVLVRETTKSESQRSLGKEILEDGLEEVELPVEESE